MKRGHFIWRAMVVAVAALVLGVVTASASDPLVFDRGLPTANLNNAAGANRSNVAWSNGNDYVSGDDFAVGATGETWVVTGIRTWVVSSGHPPATFHLGDEYANVSLYLGPSGVSLESAANLTTGSDTTSNANITLSPVTYAGGLNYQGSSGNYDQIYQVDFTGLNYTVQGGTSTYFAVDGTPRCTPLLGSSPCDYWFNHASNAALSGSTQQGADNKWIVWPKSNLSSAPTLCDSGAPSGGVCDGGWDKSSDINVQVFAHKVTPSPSSSVGGTTEIQTGGAGLSAAMTAHSGAAAAMPGGMLAAIAVAIAVIGAGGWYVHRRWIAGS